MLCTIVVAQGFSCGAVRAADAAQCSKEQLLAYTPTKGETNSHRLFTIPSINYPFGTIRDDWGLSLTVRVDESGQVICYALEGPFGQIQPLDDKRRAALSGLNNWHYAPFMRHGQAVAAILSEKINEQELPEKHVPLPDAPLDRVHIALERTGCFGTCPSYTVDIYGDGRVIYDGHRYVDVEGKHTYRVPSEQVARLIESLRAKDIWSLRPAYQAQVTDNPTYFLTMEIGGQTHHLEDYVGDMVGMPMSVSDFEHEVDAVARSNMWIHLSREAVERLEAEHFDFNSPTGAALLARAVANPDSHDDDAMLRLVTLGTPIDGGSSADPRSFGAPWPLMEEALRHQHAVLIDALIAKGAFKTSRKPDQDKIDAAFRAAIAGGSFELVKKMWEVRGKRRHPGLTFVDVFNDISGPHKHVQKLSPVTLLLSHHSYDGGSWEGLKIATWLAERGCSLKAVAANGTTLLHIAAQAGDSAFVRYLLDQGLDPSTRGQYGVTALDTTRDEDVALMLLQAGANLDLPGEYQGFRRSAEFNHWERVVAWLKAHEQ